MNVNHRCVAVLWATVLALLIGCEPSSSVPSATERSGVLATHPPASRPPLPEQAMEDRDGDGAPDLYVSSFGPISIAPGRRLVRTVRLERSPDDTFRAGIELRFEADPLAERHEHIEVIPKALASHVSDLTFSVDPVVLEADPTVQWVLDTAEDLAIDVTSLTPVVDPSERSEAITIEQALAACDDVDEEDKAWCLVRVVRRYPGSTYAEAELAECADTSLPPCAWLHAAVTGEWATYCDGLTGDGDRELCYSMMIDAQIDEACRGLAGDAQVECLSAAWEALPEGPMRDSLCVHLGFQRAFAADVDWAAFSLHCASSLDRLACDAMEDGETRERCYGALARRDGDISLCDELAEGDIYGRDRCRLDYALVHFAGAGECGSVGGGTLPDACRAIFALRDADPRACLGIADPGLLNECISFTIMRAPEFTDPDICDSISDERTTYSSYDDAASRDVCYMVIARNGADPAACDRIRDPDMADQCRLIARGYEALGEACGLLVSPVMRCICNFAGAVALADRGLCSPPSASCTAGALSDVAAFTENRFAECQELCEDLDGDGDANWAGCGTDVDCNDRNPDIHADAVEDCGNGEDDDCDGARDCDDTLDCGEEPECMISEPSEVVFVEHTGRYTVTLEFLQGQGRSFRFVPEAEVGVGVYGSGELVEIQLPAYSSAPTRWPVETVPVRVSMTGAMNVSWRIYSASNPTDPAARATSSWWEDTSDPIPMRGDRYYWLYIYPDSGTYMQEVLQLVGGAP